MKKILASLVLLLTVTTSLFASYSTDWIKTGGNYLKSGSMIARDKADNLIVAGYIQAENIYTRKYDKFGNFLWEEISSSGIPGNYEKPAWVNTDKNKDIYVVGYRYSWGSSWEYPNAVVVLKYTPEGTLLWKKNIDLSYVVGSSTGKRFNLESDLDKNGNLYIGTAGTSPAGFVLIKLNSSGTVLVNTSISLGTIHGFASMRLKGNKVVVTGSPEYVGTLAVVAWDTSGVLLWSKVIANAFGGTDVEMDGSDNVYVLSNYPNQVSPTSGGDAVIYKFNPAGVQTWKKSYDFGGYETATRFTFVAGKLSVIGYGSVNASYFDWITFQINTSGAKLWDARYNATTGNDEQPYALAAKDNGEVFVTGKGGPMFTQPNGSSYLRMITLKYNSSGVEQWVDSVNIYSGWGIGCTLASDNSLFVLGGTNMTAIHLLDHTGTGSCGIPTGLNTSKIKETSAKFAWSPVSGAYLYHLRYKTTSAAEWTIVSTDLTSIKISTLTAGTAYDYAVEAICSSGPSGYSAAENFTTTGIGYCTTGGLSTATEFLSFVWIGSIMNSTLSDNGYGDYTNLSTDLVQGSTINGYLSAFLTFGLTENYNIWIDYNHDNDFTDAGEEVVNISSNFLGWIAVNFTVPPDATPGPTRMRVTMRFGSEPTPCGNYERGETEDYTVNITSPKMNNAGESLSTITPEVLVFPNPLTDYLHAKFSGFEGKVMVQVFNLSGKAILTTTANAEELFEMEVAAWASGAYIVHAVDEKGHSASLKWIKE
ncbi:MAG TPA: GEVED domain-containing protein [Chitinophagales bacterium]|nr:GEVED domain-containing protein [Chitinophagales bacterium]